MIKSRRVPCTYFQLGLLILYLTVFLRSVLLLPIPVTVILGLYILLAFVSSEEELISLAVCCIPLEAAFQYKYGILCCAILLLIKKTSKKVLLSSSIIYIILMMIWELLHFVIGSFSFYEYLRDFAEWLLLLIILMDNKKYDFKFVAYNLINTTIFVGISMVLNLLIKYNFNFSSIFLEQDYRLGVVNEAAQISGLNYNANQLGYIFCLSIMSELILSTKYKAKIVDLIAIFLLTFLGLLTKSRSFLVILIVSLIIFFGFKKNSMSLKIKNIFYILAGGSLSVILISRFAPYILEQIVYRFKVDDISSGRILIFTKYNQLLSSKPLILFFGVGLQNILLKITGLYGTVVTQGPHNGLQEILVVWGLPGLILFVLFIVSMIKNNMVKKERLLHLSLFLITLVSCMFGQLITNSTKLIALTYIVVLMRYDFS